jgi:hypothetical protein
MLKTSADLSSMPHNNPVNSDARANIVVYERCAARAGYWGR